MTTSAVEKAMEGVYASLHNNNEDIDTHIAALKAALKEAGMKEIIADPAKLYQSNREGRKTMQNYFRKRGVTVNFLKVKKESEEAEKPA